MSRYYYIIKAWIYLELFVKYFSQKNPRELLAPRIPTTAVTHRQSQIQRRTETSQAYLYRFPV